MHISAGPFYTPKERIQPLLGEGEHSLSRAHFKQRTSLPFLHSLVSLLSENPRRWQEKLQQLARERKAVKVDDPLFQINIPWTETQVTDYLGASCDNTSS